MIRTGIGYDLHATDSDRPLVLGGVHLSEGPGLRGHSDADIVLHALTDAVLGAAGLGDIGDLFPDTDPRYKDADSAMFIAAAVRQATHAGFRINNADLVVHAERPKLGPHKATIRDRIAELLGIPPGRVNVKATTNERLGPVGTGQAMACTAIVTLEDDA